MSRGQATTYNPHLLTREALVASFVARHALLEELVDDLRRGGHQHHLLVGARGSGKTTLLLRLAVAIEDDPRLARAALPLRFPEEQYNVARPADFWLNCLDALADVLEARGDHAGKRRLEASIERVAALDEDAQSATALEALTGWARRAGKLLVLLVDNLGLILERLRGSQWGLREALSRDNRLVLIGATSTFLEEAAAYESPLYDFFNVHELGQLSEEEARGVVAQLAELTGSPEVQAVLEQEPGRFKALYVLTGGMPRMLALLAGVIGAESGPAERDLERLLDQLTPYYKARFDELPPQSQLIVDAVALHWYPITAAACAERTRLEVNLVSSQLSRLVKLGILTKVSLQGSGKLGFQLVERFFNVWYLMRASRRARQRLAWFIEFLRMFYSEQELSRRAQALLDRAPRADSSTHMLALAAAVPDPALRRRLEWRAATMLIEETRPGAIRELLDLGGVDAHLSPVLDRARTMKGLRARLAHDPKLSSTVAAILRSPFLPLARKIDAVDELVREGPKAATPWRASNIDRQLDKLFGDRLISATARGEVPSFLDVTAPDEAVALTGLAENPGLVATCLVFFLDRADNPTADAVVRALLDCVPSCADAILATAAAYVEDGEWALARRRAREILQRGAPRLESVVWSMTVRFFRACVRHGRALEAADLIAELGLSDRWLPLHEALQAAGGAPDRLHRLAPEVRIPTAELLELLQRPDPPEDHAPAAPRGGGKLRPPGRTRR